MSNVMTLPNKGPYEPEFEDLPSPGEGMAFSAFPFDQKYMDDPGWYDQLGRSLIEQRRIFTRPRSDEEQVEMVEKALEDAENSAREMDEEAEIDVDQNEIDERQLSRLWSVCSEAAMKRSTGVTRYLAREKGVNAKVSPKHENGVKFAFFYACKNGFVDVAEVLVDEAGADINRREEDDDQTPLAVAAFAGKVDMIAWLLGKGADISLTEGAQKIVFWAAASSGSLEVMKLLLETAKEREPQKAQSEFLKGWILGTAAKSASLEMFRLVLERGGYEKAADNTEQQRKDAIEAI